jgi:hypothetical protein
MAWLPHLLEEPVLTAADGSAWAASALALVLAGRDGPASTLR